VEKAPIGLGVIYVCLVNTYLQRVLVSNFLCSILWVFIHLKSSLIAAPISLSPSLSLSLVGVSLCPSVPLLPSLISLSFPISLRALPIQRLYM